ncbi:MAG: cytochrome c [Phenylobacterium sp.]|uniref:c-type cytochrome n=1 Tax=Phenylobacterium sp. TaxID=1871053 RepID=UPI0027352CC1|nr:cytochrome c [Phenylobacterium sp.]MDP3748087.1 cytochrome c [Phenylobacterium sp.]
MRALLLLPLLLATPSLAAAPDGASIYKRCSACHLPTGAGVPGAYPMLGANFKSLAASPAGRSYLILVIAKGLAGPITVEGKPFRGVMPAQTLDDAAIAATLNHVGVNVAMAGKGFRPFSAAEVAAARASGAALNAAAVGKLRAQALGR